MYIHIYYMHICISICTRADQFAASFEANCMHTILQVCENVMYMCINIYIYIHYMHTCTCICTRADHLAAISGIYCMRAMLQVCADVMYVCRIYICYVHICIYMYMYTGWSCCCYLWYELHACSVAVEWLCYVGVYNIQTYYTCIYM